MQNNIAVLLPYKDQFIKDNAGSASIWVKDFSKESKLKKSITIFGYTSNVSKTFDNFKYVNLKFSNFVQPSPSEFQSALRWPTPFRLRQPF